MAVKTINTELFRKMFLAGAANLEAKKEFINELNVFPVPDGDTGTNMTLTIMSAAKEVQSLENADMLTIAKAISSGSLRGARGNSGVILSQLLRGFTKEIREHKEIDAVILAKACERATATAYKAVMKPKEGTILTVAKGISRKAEELAETTEDLEVFIPEVIKYAEEVLAQTPEMLPVLKEAGVVDSGGQGLLEVIHGAYDAFLGKEIDYAAIEASGGTKMVKPSQQAEADIKFGYCTEFIIMTEKEFTDKNEAEFKAYLESIGDSIVCVADDDIVKIHVHTNDPGLAIQKALTYGQLSRMKIDNMREEHQEKLIKDAEKAAAQQASEKKKKEEEAQKPSIVAAAGPVVIGQGGKVTTTEPAQATVPAATLTPATPVGKASADMPGYTEIDLKQIPGDVYALMGNGKLVISIGKDEFNMTNMTANAGGALGYQNGKAVAYCTLSADQPYEAIEKADTYTLKLYAPNQTAPSAVIECKKMPSQTTPQAGQPRTYVGEIVKLLMKK